MIDVCLEALFLPFHSDEGTRQLREEYHREEYLAARFDENWSMNAFREVMGERRMEEGVRRFIMARKDFEHSDEPKYGGLGAPQCYGEILGFHRCLVFPETRGYLAKTRT